MGFVNVFEPSNDEVELAKVTVKHVIRSTNTNWARDFTWDSRNIRSSPPVKETMGTERSVDRGVSRANRIHSNSAVDDMRPLAWQKESNSEVRRNIREVLLDMGV